jgi:DNA-binding MarR family transcriptional regulator
MLKMPGKLQLETRKQHPFDALEQEAALNIQKTADDLMAMAAETFKPTGLSPTQYNVLRILRGAGEPLACGEIASRMITREPDMTRLLDRLEKRGLITRCRPASDRRVVATSITPLGVELINSLDEPIVQLHKRQLGHLGEPKLRQLIELLEEARARTE